MSTIYVCKCVVCGVGICSEVSIDSVGAILSV